MLHLLARLKIIPAGPFWCRCSQLILPDQPGQALIGNRNTIAGRKFFLNPHDVALAFAKEFSHLFYVLVISRLADR